jgi:hypothetical protein
MMERRFGEQEVVDPETISEKKHEEHPPSPETCFPCEAHFTA